MCLIRIHICGGGKGWYYSVCMLDRYSGGGGVVCAYLVINALKTVTYISHNVKGITCGSARPDSYKSKPHPPHPHTCRMHSQSSSMVALKVAG